LYKRLNNQDEYKKNFNHSIIIQILPLDLVEADD